MPSIDTVLRTRLVAILNQYKTNPRFKQDCKAIKGIWKNNEEKEEIDFEAAFFPFYLPDNSYEPNLTVIQEIDSYCRTQMHSNKSPLLSWLPFRRKQSTYLTNPLAQALRRMFQEELPRVAEVDVAAIPEVNQLEREEARAKARFFSSALNKDPLVLFSDAQRRKWRFYERFGFPQGWDCRQDKKWIKRVKCIELEELREFTYPGNYIRCLDESLEDYARRRRYATSIRMVQSARKKKMEKLYDKLFARRVARAAAERGQYMGLQSRFARKSPINADLEEHTSISGLSFFEAACPHNSVSSQGVSHQKSSFLNS